MNSVVDDNVVLSGSVALKRSAATLSGTRKCPDGHGPVNSGFDVTSNGNTAVDFDNRRFLEISWQSNSLVHCTLLQPSRVQHPLRSEVNFNPVTGVNFRAGLGQAR